MNFWLHMLGALGYGAASVAFAAACDRAGSSGDAMSAMILGMMSLFVFAAFAVCGVRAFQLAMPEGRS